MRCFVCCRLKKGQKKKSRWATPPPSALSLPSSSLSGGFVSSGRGFVKVPPAGRGKVFSQGRGLGVVPGVGSRGRDIVKRGRDVGRRSRSRSSSLSSDTRSPYRYEAYFVSVGLSVDWSVYVCMVWYVCMYVCMYVCSSMHVFWE